MWRSKSEDDIQEHPLNTMTYGTKLTPYLAIRCLKQLGFDNIERFPQASSVILHDFYVDDMLSGAENVG